MTTTPVRLGLAFVPTSPPERLRSVATAAEAAGLDELWVWEDCFKESGIATAAAALSWTSRLNVGLGLMPAPLRNVALTAMEIATLDRMFPGRFVAGVGHGVQPWMGQAGAQVESPMTLVREYAVALRRLLKGERVSVEGRYVTLDDVALDWPPLSVALTDDEILRACAVTGRTAPDVLVTQIAATGPGAQERLDAELPVWGRQPGQGIGVAGDAAAVAASVMRLARLGATAVCIQPTADEPDLEGFIAVLGREVRPLLSSAA